MATTQSARFPRPSPHVPPGFAGGHRTILPARRSLAVPKTPRLGTTATAPAVLPTLGPFWVKHRADSVETHRRQFLLAWKIVVAREGMGQPVGGGRLRREASVYLHRGGYPTNNKAMLVERPAIRPRITPAH